MSQCTRYHSPIPHLGASTLDPGGRTRTYISGPRRASDSARSFIWLGPRGYSDLRVDLTLTPASEPRTQLPGSQCRHLDFVAATATSGQVPCRRCGYADLTQAFQDFSHKVGGRGGLPPLRVPTADAAPPHSAAKSPRRRQHRRHLSAQDDTLEQVPYVPRRSKNTYQSR